jgi:hypothetical protein
MKNRIVSVMLIFAFVLSIIACKKSFFEATTNDGSINDGTGYKTKESFDAGVAGAYVNLQSAVEPLITLPAFISKDIEPVEHQPHMTSFLVVAILFQLSNGASFTRLSIMPT